MMAVPKGMGEGIDGVDRNPPSPITTALRGGGMSNLHGAMVALGDRMAQSMIDVGVPSETAGHWLRSYVRSLDLAEDKDMAWDKGGLLIIKHLTAARDLAQVAELIHNDR
jgi:hypothetical protein